MKLTFIWITTIIAMLVVSVYYLGLKPANDLLIDGMNDTMRVHALGSQAQNSFNIVSTVWGVAFNAWIVLTLVALLFWAYAKMQEREVLTGGYYS